MVTVPAHNLLAPVLACVIAAARVIPGVCAVFKSSWLPGITFTPRSRQGDVEVVSISILHCAFTLTRIVICALRVWPPETSYPLLRIPLKQGLCSHGLSNSGTKLRAERHVICAEDQVLTKSLSQASQLKRTGPIGARLRNHTHASPIFWR